MSIKLTAALPLLLLLTLGGLTTVGSCVRVTPRTATIDAGETVQLTAQGNRDTAFTWRTTNPAVATVDEAGLVTGVAEGTVIITATGDQTNSVGRARIVVRAGAAGEVTVTPTTGNVNVGATVDFNASSTDALDTSFAWSSDHENIATVDANGTVTGVAAGQAIITATGSHSGASDTATVTVAAGNVTVTINAPSTSVAAGSTLQLSATSTDPLDNYFLWSSDNQSAATVNNTTGLVSGVAVGQAVITATGNHSGASDTVQITVTGGGNTAPTANAGPDQTVPYNTLVTLDGAQSSDPESNPLTYAWQQTAGPTATLSSATAQKPTFTPSQVGAYTFQLVVNDGSLSSTADTVTITAQNTAPTATVTIEGISGEDIAARGLTTTRSSGLNTVGVGTDVYLNASATDANGDPITSYLWTIVTKPSGSAAALYTADEMYTVFTPDIVGTYEVGVLVTDNLGAQSPEQTVPIHAGTYVGVGIVNLTNPPTLTASTCTACHNGTVAPNPIPDWLGTPHATKLARDLNGLTTDFYAPECLECHTVGYYPTATNGGFDDVAAQEGWTLPTGTNGVTDRPEDLHPGVWEGLVTDHPALARLGNIQCENCHGPASQHPPAAFSEDKKISVSLDSGVCGQCHHQEVQWERSGHSDATAQAFTYPVGPTRTACVKCHSGVGYIDFSENVTPLRTSMQVHSCAVCHDPHSAANESQLRIAGEATLPGDTVVPDAGPSATCMTCHNGRQTPADALNNGFPHYSTASENLMALNAITFGHTLQSSPHRLLTSPAGQTKCVMCHMAPTPGIPRDEILAPGEDQVGEHTFLLASDNGTPEDTSDDFTNVANACAVCHAGLTTFNRPANGDYDGDGTTEGIQDEVQGLLDLVLGQLEASGVTHVDHYPYWSNVTTDLQRQCIYNHELVSHDGSRGVHNAAFSVGVLQITYRELAGTDVPNATLRYTP